MQSTIHAYLYPSKTFIQWADKSSDGRDNRHSVHHGSRLSISIHVSRTGNDTAVGVRRRVVRVISIRASHMESDLKRSRNSSIVCIFQSTLPAWGATAGVLCLIAVCFTNTFARTGDALIFGYHITPFQQTFTSCLIDLRARR